MTSRSAFLNIIGGLCIGASGTAAAQQGGAELVTGVNNTGPALIILAVAAGLILTLILRPTVTAAIGIIAKNLGKRRISRILRAKGPDVLDDFILPGAYGGLTHIDHALLTSGGVLCIQTKHYSGIIFGESGDPQWTNVCGAQRRRFLNPIIQNEGRANALRKIVPDLPVANLVVFTGNVDFTSARDKNVIHLSELESFIARFEFGPSKIDDWDTTWLTIKSSALVDEESRKDFDAQLSFG